MVEDGQGSGAKIINLFDRYPHFVQEEVPVEEAPWEIKELGAIFDHPEPFEEKDEEGKVVRAQVLLISASQVNEEGNVVFPTLFLYPQQGEIKFFPASDTAFFELSQVDTITPTENGISFRGVSDTESIEMEVARDGVMHITLIPDSDVVDPSPSIGPAALRQAIMRERTEFDALDQG